MVETYFAIRVYAFYVMVAILGVCAVVLAAIIIADWVKKRLKGDKME